MTKTILQAGRVAVITGAGAGIGAAAARFFAKKGMKLVLFDKNLPALEALAADLETDYRLLEGDVSRQADLKQLHELTYREFGKANLLFNNAAISNRANPWSDLETWRQVMEVNLFALVELQALFVPSMLASQESAAIVNLGSKEGITTPPGNAVYSVTKAGVKVLTEQLQHELRNLPDHQVSAHLLVPGYTWTPMNFPNADFSDPANKPPEPWSPDELMAYFAQRLDQGDFYIICPDNEVTAELDAKRMTWAVGDLINNRPALSRWHKDYQADFQTWLDED